jgi:hypothetical protein
MQMKDRYPGVNGLVSDYMKIQSSNLGRCYNIQCFAVSLSV